MKNYFHKEKSSIYWADLEGKQQKRLAGTLQTRWKKEEKVAKFFESYLITVLLAVYFMGKRDDLATSTQ